MFQIGEFSRIARISTRQLRHYDNIGLFVPVHVDAETGYRYYRAEQLPRLNRILALKDLGMTLEQIQRLMTDNISADEIHGMLTLKKAQVEQTLQEELRRFRSIEERLWQIETEGVLSDEDVVLKSMPQQQFLSIRETVPTIADGFALIYDIHRLLPVRTEPHILGNFGVLFHTGEFVTENIDVEMGFLLAGPFLETVEISGGRVMTQRTLPAAETVATLARVGIYSDSVGHYGAVGTWMERHNFQLDGPGWEVFLEPFDPGKEDEAVVEIRLPVRKFTQRNFRGE